MFLLPLAILITTYVSTVITISRKYSRVLPKAAPANARLVIPRPMNFVRSRTSATIFYVSRILTAIYFGNQRDARNRDRILRTILWNITKYVFGGLSLRERGSKHSRVKSIDGKSEGREFNYSRYTNVIRNYFICGPIRLIVYLTKCLAPGSQRNFKMEPMRTYRNSDLNRRRLMNRAKTKSLRISVVIVAAFLIWWTPYYTMMIILLFINPDDHVSALRFPSEKGGGD